MERSDAQTDLITETYIDIAINAGYLLAKGEISAADSRELVSTIKTLAQVFEQSGYDPDDYIGQVDEFAKKRLLENYGSSAGKQKDQESKSSDKIYILYACDEWKSRDSMRLVGATTDRESLYAMIASEIYNRHMDFDGETGKPGVVRFRDAYRNGCIDPGMLDYGFVDETYNRDYLTPDSSLEHFQLYELLDMDDDEFQRTLPVDPASYKQDDEDEPEQDDGLEP
jgi:hypothetical protein